MVDLDEPDQLFDGRSNKLLIVSDDSGQDEDQIILKTIACLFI